MELMAQSIGCQSISRSTHLVVFVSSISDTLIIGPSFLVSFFCLILLWLVFSRFLQAQLSVYVTLKFSLLVVVVWRLFAFAAALYLTFTFHLPVCHREELNFVAFCLFLKRLPSII